MTTRDHVQVLLDIAGISPSEAEIDGLTKSFAETRARIERMWDLDLVDVAPALVFRAGEAAGPKETIDV